MEAALFSISLSILIIALDIASAQTYPVRLAGSLYGYEGRVEVLYEGVWGTVCDHGWGRRDAMVVCQQLGFSDAVNWKYRGALTSQGTGPIWLTDVRCNGYESSLDQCTHSGWGNSGCSHSQDASVTCVDHIMNNNGVRLAGGYNNSEGRVEINHGGIWGTVCDWRWDLYDAGVVCRQLGFAQAVAAYRNAFYGPGIGNVWLDRVNCNGSETSLHLCPHRGWGKAVCSHMRDAGVRCTNNNGSLITDIRLVDGADMYEGRIEIQRLGADWGTVCDDNWGRADATVACRQLGFSGAERAYRNALFGEGNGTILMDNVGCNGDESSLEECTHNGWGINNCGHSEDAGVRCTNSIWSTGAIVGTVFGVIFGVIALIILFKICCCKSKPKYATTTTTNTAVAGTVTNDTDTPTTMAGIAIRTNPSIYTIPSIFRHPVSGITANIQLNTANQGVGYYNHDHSLQLPETRGPQTPPPSYDMIGKYAIADVDHRGVAPSTHLPPIYSASPPIYSASTPIYSASRTQPPAQPANTSIDDLLSYMTDYMNQLEEELRPPQQQFADVTEESV